MKILISELHSITRNEEFITLIKDKVNNKPVLFIPSVIEAIELTAEFIDDIVQIFNNNNINFSSVDHFTEEIHSNDYLENIEKYGLIFLMGGLTENQNRTLIQYGFDTILSSYKGVLLGLSAGALNMCEDTVLTPEESANNEHTLFNGLGLVDLSIEVHFDFTNPNQLKHLDNMNKEIYCITDNGAIIISDNKTHFIGDVYHYNTNQELHKL